MTTLAEAIARAGGTFEQGQYERDEASRGGLEAVVQHACPSGTSEKRARVAALYARPSNQAAGMTAA